MPLKLSDATIITFDNVFEKFRSEAANHKPTSFSSWLTKTPPLLLAGAPASLDDIAHVQAQVGDRPTCRNSQHPWRLDLRFKLIGVPTLVRWENDTVKDRLEGHEAHLEPKKSIIFFLPSGNGRKKA